MRKKIFFSNHTPPAKGIPSQLVPSLDVPVSTGLQKYGSTGSQPAFDQLREAAFAYARLGHRVVLVGGEKRPLQHELGERPDPGQGGFHLGTSDPRTLGRYFERAAAHVTGIGLVTGGQCLIALDADGPCAVAWAERQLGNVNNIPREQTKRGVHYFFGADPTVRRSTHRIDVGCTCGGGCGIDVLASTKRGSPAGLVVIWPTSPRTWLWPVDGLPALDDLPPLPEQIRKLTARAEPSERSKPAVAPGSLGPISDAKERYQELLGELRRSKSGTHHSTLLRVASLVGNLIAHGYCLSVAEAVEEMLSCLPDSCRRLHRSTATEQLRWGIEHPLPDPAPDPPNAAERYLGVPRRAIIAANIQEGLARWVPPEMRSMGEKRAVVRREIADALEHGGITLIQAETGLGKTTMCLDAVSKLPVGERVVFSTRNHRLVDEIEAQLMADPKIATKTVVHLQGRRPPTVQQAEQVGRMIEAGKSVASLPVEDGVCWMMHVVEPVAEERQYISPVVCATCPVGLATMARIKGESADPFQPNCGYILGQQKARDADIVLAVHQAITPQLVSDSDHLIVDEPGHLLSSARVRGCHVSEWMEGIAGRIAWLKSAKERHPDDTYLISVLQDGNKALSKLYETFQERGIDYGELGNIIADLGEVSQSAASNLHSGNSVRAVWETARVDWTTETVVALYRACRAMVWSLEHGFLEMVDTAQNGSIIRELIAWEPTGLGEVILSNNRVGATLLLDATPSLALRRAVELLHGRIVEATDRQPVLVLVDDSHAMGRGAKAIQGKRQTEGVALCSDLLHELRVATQSQDVACITHKPWAEVVDSLGAGSVAWWEAERGTNALAGHKAVTIVGGPSLSPQALTNEYREARALALAAGDDPDAWPVWDDNTEIGGAIDQDGHTWPGYLPVEDHQKRWALERWADHEAQALGRVRAADVYEATGCPVIAYVVGPWPWEQMKDRGYEAIRVTRGIDELGQSPKVRGGAARAQADLRVLWAVEMIERSDSRPTFSSVNELLLVTTGRGTSHRVWRRVMDSLRQTAPKVEMNNAILAVAHLRATKEIRLRKDIPDALLKKIDSAARTKRNVARLKVRLATMKGETLQRLVRANTS